MSEDYIKGLLIGDRIEIVCTKNQGKLLRARLADWLDEESTNTVPFTKEDVKGYLDDCVVFWREKRDSISEYSSVTAMKEHIMAIHYIDAYQSVRMSLFGELLQKEEEDD